MMDAVIPPHHITASFIILLLLKDKKAYIMRYYATET
jgi:hypothetical protein